MTLDDIRKMVAEQRAEIGEMFAGVTDLCDTVEALLAVVDALPKCVVCGLVATREHERAWCCDKHACFDCKDLVYADALRAITRKL